MNAIKKKKAIERVNKILKSHDIELVVYGCGCCQSPNVTFKYEGEVILDDVGECNINFTY